MSRGIIQEQFKKDVQAPKMLASTVLQAQGQVQRTLELTREADFVNGSYDIFDLLAHKSTQEETLERSIGATIALLKRSGLMLQAAEQKIEAQEKQLKEMEALSIIDKKSGLLNRRGFIQTFSKELARIQRQSEDGGLLVMFNFENLSMISKTHGTEAADMAMRLMTKALESDSRQSDYVARLLYDEFVLLFTNTSMSKALPRLQNMALRLNKLSLIWDGVEINLHLSLGLKSYNAQDRATTIFSAASEDLQRNRKGISHVKHA